MLAEEEQEQLSLKQLYDQVWLQWEQHESGLLESKQLGPVIESAKKCQWMVEQLSLFSTNETLQDIATGDLKFLWLDYIVADLLQKQSVPEGVSATEWRINILKESKENYFTFLNRLFHYEFLNEKEAESFQQFSTNNMEVLNKPKPRMEKIEAYKYQKQLKQEIELLKRYPEHQLEIYKKWLEWFKLQAFEHLSLLVSEISLLENSKNEPPRPPVAPQPIPKEVLSKDGKVMRPFQLIRQREQIRDRVFKPGHNLPTMTIDEYLDEQFQMGNFIAASDKSKTKPESDSEDETDEKIQKQRAWDAFKDDNPRGWGNRMNKG